MASTMSRDNYTFRAEPKAVKSRPKYRGQDEYQLEAVRSVNLMNDRRICRGNTFSRKPQIMPVDPTPQRRRPVQNVPQRPMKEIPRVPTPEPVPGRVHMQVQTDNYLEDLREKVNEHDFGTQTDPELDYPEKPLFEPQSSGLDMYTYMEEGDLFDFDMEVEPVLQVITSKSIDQALLEVLEEEEMKDMLDHRQAYNQERNAQLAELQRLEAKDIRFEAEKARRIQQAVDRVKRQDQITKRQAAATTAKEFYMDMQTRLVNQLAAAGFFYDPALKQVNNTFLPWLVKSVGVKLEEQHQARRTVDAMIDAAQHRIKIDHSDQVFTDIDLIKVRGELEEHTPPTLSQDAYEYCEWDARRRFQALWGFPRSNIIFGLEASVDRQTLEEAKKLLKDAEEAADFELPKVEADLGCTTVACTGQGVYVKSVVPCGSMSHATLCAGDVILSIDGNGIESPSHFEESVKTLELGKVLDVIVVRGFDGREEILKVEVFASDRDAFSPMQVRSSRASMHLAVHSPPIHSPASAQVAMSQLIAKHLGLVTNDESGLLVVTEVPGNGPAQRAGVAVEDVITRASSNVCDALGEPTKDNLQQWLENVPAGEMVTLHILRAGAAQQLDLEVAVAGETVEFVRSLRLMAGLAVAPEKGFNDSRVITETDEADEADVEGGEEAMSAALDELKALTVSLGFTPAPAPEGTEGVVVTEVDTKLLPKLLITLANGDIITHVNGEPVTSPEDLHEKCNGLLAGEVLKVKCLRNFDKRMDILGFELPSTTATTEAVRELRTKAGLPVNDDQLWTQDEAIEWLNNLPSRVGFRIIEKDGGVCITEIHEHSTAMNSPAVIGDVIMKVNGQEVHNPGDFLRATRTTLPGDPIDYECQRKNLETQETETVTFKSEMGVGDPNIRQEAVWSLRVIAGMVLFTQSEKK